MCGEHQFRVVEVRQVEGSSPHVRGAPLNLLSTLRVSGIIPACAGSTTPSRPTRSTSRDHPRMCGEHGAASHPRDVLAGSSPHVRGARCRAAAVRLRFGIIPACAGSTALLHMMTLTRSGSSPHVRGALIFHIQRPISLGIIPACAGSTCRCSTSKPNQRDHPRMCGEHMSDYIGGDYAGWIIPACAGSTGFALPFG